MPGYSSVHAIYATGFRSVTRAFELDGKQVTLPAGTAFPGHKMCETPRGDSFTFYAKTGASANAFSYDRTCYLFSATQKIDENLDIYWAWSANRGSPRPRLPRSRGIIGQEIKMYDDAQPRLWRLLNAVPLPLPPTTRCAAHPAGTVEGIAGS